MAKMVKYYKQTNNIHNINKEYLNLCPECIILKDETLSYDILDSYKRN